MLTLEEMKSQIEKLPEAERRKLWGWLTLELDSFEDDGQGAPELSPEWKREIRRRSAELKTGKAKTSPAGEVLERLGKKHGVDLGIQ